MIRNYPVTDLPPTASFGINQLLDDCDCGLLHEIKKKDYVWKVQAFAPHSISTERLMQINTGGLLSSQTSLNSIVNYYNMFSKLYPDGLCIFQDIYMSPRDFKTHKQKCSGGFFLNNLVYSIVDLDESSGLEFRRCFNDLRNPFDFFAVFFDKKSRLKDIRTNMSFEKGLYAVITSAYDGEGFLLHTPA